MRCTAPCALYSILNMRTDHFVPGDLIPTEYREAALRLGCATTKDEETMDPYYQAEIQKKLGYAAAKAQEEYMYRAALAPINHRHTVNEGTDMATTTEPTGLHLYEVYVADSRLTDDVNLAVYSEFVRAESEEGAKLATILRNAYGEADLPYLDFSVHGRAYGVKRIINDE